MSRIGSTSAGRRRSRLAVTALTLAPILVVLSAVPAPTVEAAMPGVEATVTVDGAATDASPGAPLASPDGVMEVAVGLANDVGSTADVTVDAGWAAPCSIRLADGASHTCSGLQYRPTQLGTTTRNALVTTQAEWDALELGDIGQIAFGEHHGCVIDAISTAWCWGANGDGRVGDATTVNRVSAVPVAGPPGGRQYTRITAGQRHTCALDTAGAAWCWGAGANGRLGTGTLVNSNVPVQVAGTRTFGAIAAGDAHTCAIATNPGDIGKIFCWGQGTLGRLGTVVTTDQVLPTQVVGAFPMFADVAAGGAGTCAVTVGPPSALYCWGDNASGQGGQNPVGQDKILAPALVAAPGGVVFSSVDVGANHTCALATVGTAWCWGGNASGQLGSGDTIAAWTPTEVAGGAASYDTISAGDRYTCAIADDSGEPWCWGESDQHRLGVAAAGDQTTPQQVPGSFVALATTGSGAVAGGTTCALTASADVRCWGAASGGETGGGPDAPSVATPSQVPLAGTLSRAVPFHVEVAGTASASLTATVDGAPASSAPYPWAQAGATISKAYLVTNTGTSVLNAVRVTDSAGATAACPGGGLAPGATMTCTAPAVMSTTDVDHLATGTATANVAVPIARIATGTSHTCGTSVAGTAWCWGANSDGQLGNGAILPSRVPAYVATFDRFDAIDAGAAHTCALRDTDVYCWGDGAAGQLANGNADSTVPVRVTPDAAFEAVAAGGATTCALVTGGTVRCWGLGDNGQLGNSATASSATPVQVTGSGYASVSVGNTHACVLGSNHVASCFGANGSGQLGVGDVTSRSAPTPVAGGHEFAMLSAGTNFTCGLTTSGAAWCWGLGSNGQLGNGASSTSSSPVAVAGGRTYSTIAAGGTTACAITAAPTAGQLWCWGGGGTTPVRIGAASDWSSVSVGANHQCALASGGVACWGANASGQLGDDSSVTRPAPTPAQVPPAPATPTPATTATATGPLRARWQPSHRITVTRTVNGVPAAAAPGNEVSTSTLSLGYTITNVGMVSISNVVVSESGVTLSCPSKPPVMATTGPTSSFTCSATRAAPDAGTTWTSTMTASGSWLDPPGYSGTGGTVSATAEAIVWTNAAPRLTISAAANGNPASSGAGAEVAAGGPVNLVYTITNSSAVTVDVLSLSNAGTGVSCATGLVAPGAATTCTAATTGPAAGTTATLAPVVSAKWTRPDASEAGFTTSGVVRVWSDATPVVSLAVRVGGDTAPAAPGKRFDPRDDVAVTFVVGNPGPVPVSSVHLVTTGITGVTCPSTSIAAGAQITCTGTLADAVYALGHEVTGSVTASWTNPGGAGRQASADGHAYLWTDGIPELTVTPRIASNPGNAGTAPGAQIGPDDDIIVIYTIANTGDITVADLDVADDAGAVNCGIVTELAPGDDVQCSSLPVAGITVGSTWSSSVTVQGSFRNIVDEDRPVSVTRSVYAWTDATPAISMVAQIGGVARPTAPGSRFEPGTAIPVQIIVTNTGPVSVTRPVISLGLGAIVCPVGSVVPGTSVTCSASITAPPNGTQLSFAPSVSATWVNAAGSVRTATASAGLFAWVDDTPTITLAARINGNDADTAPGVEVAAGTAVSMTYVVRNTSGVALTGVTVSDPGVAVSCPATTLSVGASVTCTAARPAAVAGASVNATATASATWVAPNNTPRVATTTNPAHAWTNATPTLAVAAAVGTATDDAPPGPRVTGATMTLRSVVTNTGPVPVSDVQVDDSIAGVLGCPTATLAPGASMTCTTTTAAPSAGATWASIGTATGSWTNAAGGQRTATGSDAVHAWTAAEPAIQLLTKLNGLGASMPPGLQLEPGDPVTVAYLVTNSAAVPLTGVHVQSADVTGVTCPATTIAPGETLECSGTLTAPGGGQLAAVRGSVSASWTDPTGAVKPAVDDDAAYLWTTGQAGVLAAMRVNGHADTGDGVAVLPGAPAMVAVLVYNTGNVALTDISVTTSPNIGLRCPSTALAVDGVMSCTGTVGGPADAQRLELVVRVEARWLDRVASSLRTVEHRDAATVIGSREAPDPVITLDPSRLFETRPGLSTTDGRQNGVGRLADGQIVRVKVAGRGGVPTDAASAVLNLTATGATDAGYVTVWPCDPQRPLASSLNYVAGRTVANSVIVKLDGNGDVCMYTLRATELIVDVNGYALVDGLESVTPARVLDTRPDHGTIDGAQSGGGIVATRTSVRVQVAGRGGVPADATAAVLNVIATETEGDGYLTVYPCNGDRPNASTLNYQARTTVTNSIVAKLDAEGGVCVFTLATAQIVVDVNGFARESTGVTALVPARLVDTRAGTWNTIDGDQAQGGFVPAGTSLRVRVAGRGGVPAGVQTVLLNLSAVGATRPGYLTAFPCSSVPPSASNVNYEADRVVANSAIVQLDEQGDLCLFSLADTDVLVDVTGYLTPR